MTLLYGIVAMNLLTFLAFGLAKWTARKGKWRVRGLHLLCLAAATGAIGAWTGVSVFRHEQQKRSFRFWLFVATAFNAVWVWLLL